MCIRDRAYTTRQRMKNSITKEEMEPDENFMKSIEEQIGQLKIPLDMYSWYREFADSPSSYIHRF